MNHNQSLLKLFVLVATVLLVFVGRKFMSGSTVIATIAVIWVAAFIIELVIGRKSL